MTISCPHCGRRIDDLAPNPADSISNREIGSHEGEAANDWISVGRFTNLAEVGYFSDLFVSQEIPCRTRQHDEFRATDGSWGVLFILQVPEPLADRAVDMIKAELARDDGDADLDADVRPWPGVVPAKAGESVPPGLARSALLVVVVGGLAFLAGRAGSDAKRSTPPAPPLWRTLVEIEGPLQTEIRAGNTPYRIHLDRRSGSVRIERDTDDDARFEPWRHYERGRLVDN